MRIYSGNEIRNIIDNERLRSYKERTLMPQLVNYLNSENDGKVMVLRGLRRTGKTVMMQQAILNYIGADDTLYIQCQNNDHTNDIADVILASKKKYVFLDEVTKVSDFINLASVFSDESALAGHKIVMAGTDSLGFAFAKNNELFNRMLEIRTTYIPFAEYFNLTEKDLFDYMRYGGTLCEENYFYNEDTLKEYTNSAIVDNILHTYENWDKGKHKVDFYPAKTAEDIRSLVNYYVRIETKRFIADSLEKFEASEFHSPAQMFERHARDRKRFPEMHKNEHIPDTKPLRDAKLAAEWQSILQINDDYPFEITTDLIYEIRENLLKLDVLDYVKNDIFDNDDTSESNDDSKKDKYLYYFTQPGMRYCHIQLAIDTLKSNEKVRKEYSEAEIDAVVSKIREDIEGHLLEDIVLLDMKKRFTGNKDISVRKFSRDSADYDVVVTNNSTHESIAFEVKRSDQMVERQKKHLVNKEFQDTFERLTGAKVVKKAVLYSGKTQKDDNGFQYINTSDFLNAVVNNLNTLCPGFIKSEARKQMEEDARRLSDGISDKENTLTSSSRKSPSDD